MGTFKTTIALELAARYTMGRLYLVLDKCSHNGECEEMETNQKAVAAYVRVSTVGQNEQGQRAEIVRWLAGNGIADSSVRWFVDKRSGDNLNRPAFEELQAAIFNGEVGTVVVFKLDRISRSSKRRDQHSGRLVRAGHSRRIDFATARLQRLGRAVDGGGAIRGRQMEQETRRERQAAGIAVAKRIKGKYKGRPPGSTKAKPARALKLKEKGLSAPEIARSLGVSRNTVFRYFREVETVAFPRTDIPLRDRCTDRGFSCEITPPVDRVYYTDGH